MRRVIATTVCVLAGLLLLIWVLRPQPAKRAEKPDGAFAFSTGELASARINFSNTAAVPPNTVTAAHLPTNKSTVASQSKTPASTEIHKLPEITEPAPRAVMENMRSAFRQYAARFNGNPVGTNPEITAALNAGNPKQTQFLHESDGLRVNGRGELVDSWGTPFFFHQLSATEMEIHSAGPDLKMWTADDLVLK
jgi:hypothetical protein